VVVGTVGAAGFRVHNDVQSPAEVPPPKPFVYVLRPDLDPRLDASTLTRYDPPAHLRTGAAVVIMPGGNYDFCSAIESQPVAVWFNSLGITGFVLRYRCVSEGHYWPAQWEDYKAAFRLICKNATEWQIDRNRIGVIGFSAGGHLAGMAATTQDPSLRPNAHILVYPSIDVKKPDHWYWKVEEGYPGEEDSLHLRVTSSVPPAFLTVSTEDVVCVAEEQTDPYAAALKAAGVPFEYFKKPMGNHGHALKGGWTAACEKWLVNLGWARCMGLSQEDQTSST